jgi:DNA-binding MarR family transcriptional regulator
MKALNSQSMRAWRHSKDPGASDRIVPNHDASAHVCVLGLLATSREVRSALAKRMRVLVFSEAQLAILVALHALDPTPASVDTLSCETGVGFRHLVLVIDSLLAEDLVEEETSPDNCPQGLFRLTEKGRETSVVAAHLFLDAVDELTQGLSVTQFTVLEEACRHVTHQARHLRV